MAASPEQIDKCVHCGFCLPACPTYVLWGNEADSPRGRIYLMKLHSDGAAKLNRDWVKHFDSCLGCVSCMTACPSGVPYGQLIEATRSHIESNYGRSVFDRLFRQSIFALFPRIDRLSKLRTFLTVYQKSGLQTLLRATGLIRVLPARLRAMEGLAPKLAPPYVAPGVTPAVGKNRKKVAVMLGCVQREFLGDINAATIRVLAAEGCEVLAPIEQGCCGALLVHAGEEARAVELAKQVIDTFEPLGVDAIITNAGGCGSNVKEYDHLLRNTPYAARAKAFVAKCRDITEFLAEIGTVAQYKPVKARVAYHDSCHLQHAQKVRTQPRELLRAIPEMDVVDIPEAPLCCGSAGIYNLVQPGPANELADRKAALVAPLNVGAIATGNPGCLLQIGAALERSGQKTPILHTIQILDASLRGESIPN